MAMGCPHQGRSGGLNATITSRPFDSPRPSPGGYVLARQVFRRRADDGEHVAVEDAGTPVARSLRITSPLTPARPRAAFSAATPTHFVAAKARSGEAAQRD